MLAETAQLRPIPNVSCYHEFLLADMFGENAFECRGRRWVKLARFLELLDGSIAASSGDDTDVPDAALLGEGD